MPKTQWNTRLDLQAQYPVIAGLLMKLPNSTTWFLLPIALVFGAIVWCLWPSKTRGSNPVESILVESPRKRNVRGTSKNIAWAEPTATDLIAYTVGYSAGYLAEQVVLSLIKTVFVAPLAFAGVVTTGAKVAKMMKMFKAGEKVIDAVATGKELAAKLQKVKNLAVKSCSQFVTDKTGLDKIEPIVQRTLMAGCATP